MGGSFTVSIVEELAADKVRVRVWYGRATAQGWEAWKDWDLSGLTQSNAVHDTAGPALACNPKGFSSSLRSVATATRCTRPCLPNSSFAITHNH